MLSEPAQDTDSTLSKAASTSVKSRTCDGSSVDWKRFSLGLAEGIGKGDTGGRARLLGKENGEDNIQS